MRDKSAVLENATFESQFDLWTNDQQRARELFTPAVSEALALRAKPLPFPLSISLVPRYTASTCVWMVTYFMPVYATNYAICKAYASLQPYTYRLQKILPSIERIYAN